MTLNHGPMTDHGLTLGGMTLEMAANRATTPAGIRFIGTIEPLRMISVTSWREKTTCESASQMAVEIEAFHARNQETCSPSCNQ